ncbi:hypothetical protein H2248_010216 [Termitomyces sp. 'cryptogamus']|nr:hypothetical protein H2248_010216 [Termitomyces sp. 'cryptogamus']
MMAHTDNMRQTVIYIPYSDGKELQISSFHHSTLPSNSTDSSDLPGNLSSTGPRHGNFSTLNYCKYGLARDSYQLPLDFPPSPPPTNSDQKRSVPLPNLGSNAEAGPSLPILSRYRHPRELYITISTKCVPLLSFPVPMTPPPTIPTPTLGLPPADTDIDMDLDPGLSPIPTSHDDWDASLLGLPLSSSCPDQGMDHLLSPISPEWTRSGIVYDVAPSLPSNSSTASVLLGGNHSNLFASESLSYLQESDNTSPQCRPILPHLDIPFSIPKSTWTESPTSSVDFDEELNILATPNTLDTNMDVSSTPRSLSTIPFEHEFFPPEDKLFENDFRGEKYLNFLEPLTHELEFLPELDDIPDSPSSPSLRSFSTLPSLDEDDNLNGLTSPPSPGATLIPLPGTDPDEFLPDPDSHLLPGILTASFGSSSGSLLLLEDESIPRSPSPENWDVDPAFIEDSTDPDIRRLNELRRRSFSAERAARQLEQTLLEQGAVHQRWEARRVRKKEKERGREIGAMLRLKMVQEKERERKRLRAEGVEIEEREEERAVEKKGMVSCMEQLVAKMLLRRNDTYRSLANRKTPLTFKFYKSSPLVRHNDFVDMDVNDGHEYENESSNLPWTGDSEYDSGPRTLSTFLPQSSMSSF